VQVRNPLNECCYHAVARQFSLQSCTNQKNSAKAQPLTSCEFFFLPCNNSPRAHSLRIPAKIQRADLHRYALEYSKWRYNVGSIGDVGGISGGDFLQFWWTSFFGFVQIQQPLHTFQIPEKIQLERLHRYTFLHSNRGHNCTTIGVAVRVWWW
jgi:hypothetical protein